MRRRVALAILAGAGLAFPLDTAGVLDVVEPLASSLSSGDGDVFMAAVPNDVPERERLGSNVRALLEAVEVTCSVSVSAIEGDTAQLDWYMELRSKRTQTVSERRRGALKVRVVRGKLRSIEPVDFFKPPEF